MELTKNEKDGGINGSEKYMERKRERHGKNETKI